MKSAWPVVAALSGLLAVLLAGCGGPKSVKVYGTLTRDGQPLKVSEDTYVTITLTPAEDKTQSYPAKFKHNEGTYEVAVPPGTYRASVLVVPPGGKPPLKPPADASKTYEINKDQQLDLDVPK
jgi:hypothetical protein